MTTTLSLFPSIFIFTDRLIEEDNCLKAVGNEVEKNQTQTWQMTEHSGETHNRHIVCEIKDALASGRFNEVPRFFHIYKSYYLICHFILSVVYFPISSWTFLTVWCKLVRFSDPRVEIFTSLCKEALCLCSRYSALLSGLLEYLKSIGKYVLRSNISCSDTVCTLKNLRLRY
jgi:hypothetical protein